MAVANVISYKDLLLYEHSYLFEVAPQGDGRARKCEATLYRGEDDLYPLEDSYIIVLEGKNAGGYNVFNKCEIKDKQNSIIQIPYSNGVLSFAGLGTYRITIYDKNSSIDTFNFNIFVSEAPYDIIKLQASDSYEALNDLVSNAGEFNKWMEGSGPPLETGSNGNVGDLYLDRDSGDIYKKISEDQWKYSGGNIKSKVFIKYSYLDNHSDWKDDPSDVTPYAKYIGVYTGYRTKDGYNYASYDYETVNPLTINDFEWALFRNGIASYKNEYAISSDGENAPTSGWTTTVPTVPSGYYLWSRTDYTFDKDPSTHEYTYGVSRNGVSIKNIKVEYYVSTDGNYSTVPSASWTTSFPGIIDNGKYLITKTTIVDDDDNVLSTSYSVMYQGIAINRIKTQYAVSNQGTDPSSILSSEWKDTIQSLDPGQYLWTKFIPLGNDPSSTQQGDPSYSVYQNVKAGTWYVGEEISGTDSVNGVTGHEGIKGDMYLNSATGNVYLCVKTGVKNVGTDAALWVYQKCNIRGVQGVRGSKWFTGTSMVNSAVNNEYYTNDNASYNIGDCYILTTDSSYYECITAGEGAAARWTKVGSFRGIQGLTGDRGSRWFVGRTNPDANGVVDDPTGSIFGGEAIRHDFYLNVTNNNYYVCDGFKGDDPTWANVGSISTTSNGDMKSSIYCGTSDKYNDAGVDKERPSVRKADTLTGERLLEKILNPGATSLSFKIAEPSDTSKYTCKIFVSNPSASVMSSTSNNGVLTLTFPPYNEAITVAVEVLQRFRVEQPND